ncbi:MAG TPA: EthD family reductase [Anaerolineales bacterium]|nr:EthD family reductase [Anaerolineales bacterium]
MHKLMVLIRRPADPAAFDERWSREFVPLAERMPGLRRVTLSRMAGSLSADLDLHMVHEFFFDDLVSVQSAMTSPEGQRAGQALMAFAASEASLCFAEHMEMDLRGGGSSA